MEKRHDPFIKYYKVHHYIKDHSLGAANKVPTADPLLGNVPNNGCENFLPCGKSQIIVLNNP